MRLRHGVAFAAALVILWLAAGSLSRAQRGQPSFERDTYDGRPVVAGEVLVRFREGATPALAMRDADASDDEPIAVPRWRKLRSTTRNVDYMMRALSGRADVELVEPNYVIEADRTPNDVQYPELYGMQRISAPAAWDVTTGNTRHVVAVLDTGIDQGHPDLVGNLWSAPTAFSIVVQGQTISCPAGTRGYNFVSRTCSPGDGHGHGTHVSGTIGATGNNGIGVPGVNWQTRIMALKILDDAGQGSVSSGIAAIDFAIRVRSFFAASGAADVRILSNSYGGTDYSTPFLQAIESARSADMLFVASAGNEAKNNDTSPAPTYPASYQAQNVVAVAATTQSDALADYSNYGPARVHLAAPGSGILSTVNGSYGGMSGTSMAAPHVSGAAALVLSACPMNTVQLKAALLNNVDVVPALAGKVLNGGRLNVDRAVRSCATVPQITLTSPLNGASYVDPASVLIEASASDPDGIARVDFYSNGALIASDSTSPYGLTWSGVATGQYSVTSVAVDNLGVPATSATSSITVLTSTGGVPQVFFTSDQPSLDSASDGVQYELGMQFRSDVAGTITALRYWKGPLESGPHVGKIWGASGQVLATVTFANETASGWQQMSLASPLVIAANTDYRVSVTTGATTRFAVHWSLLSTALSRGHLQTPENAGRYGPVGTAPATVASGSYFRDVVFVPGAVPDVSAPTVTLTQPTAGTSISGHVAVTATASDDVAVAGVQFAVDGAPIGGEDQLAPYTVTWDSTTVGNGSHQLTATARDGSGRIKTAAVTVTVANTAPSPQTFFTAEFPEGQSFSDGALYELGMQFRSDVAGTITALRYWKGPLEGGPHVGTIWAGGQVLATVTFANETPSGWQQMSLASPLVIAANTDYLVSVTTGSTPYFVSRWTLLGTATAHGHLQTPANAGRYGPVGAMPTIVSPSSYFRDVVFVASAVPDPIAPTVTLTQPTSGASVSGPVVLAATANDDVAVAGVQFAVDGVPVGSEDQAFPYAVTWDSTTVGNGMHQVTATARDGGGRTTTAATTVTVANSGPSSQTFFTSEVPEGQSFSDNRLYDLGMQFRSDVAGTITALRYWKGPLEAGPHVGKIWAGGQVVATVTFTNETPSGWQQMPLPSPLVIAANTDYLVSVTTGTTPYFVSSWTLLQTPTTRGYLRTPGNAGRYGLVGGVPTTISPSSYFRDVVFVASASLPQTFLTSEVPEGQSFSDGIRYELGMQFRSDVAGKITALRYWKGPLEAGPHVGTIWVGGQALATVTFTNETASGWQQMPLPSPLVIAANTDYLVSVTTGTTPYFVSSWTLLQTPTTRGYLRAPGNAGRYGPVGGVPTTVSPSSYFRDVVFVPD